MTQHEELRWRIVIARSDANGGFAALRLFLLRMGFVERVRGSHHIFRKQGVQEHLNLQRDGSHPKPYQAHQVRSVVLKCLPQEGVLMHKYEIIIYWSNEDGLFIAEVPELAGCMAHGDTQEQALQHVNDAVVLWLDTAREFGDPVPEPKGERLMLA